MGLAFPTLDLATLRRAAFTAAVCAITIAIGTWLIPKSRYYGLSAAVLPLAVGIPAWFAITRKTGLALAVLLLYLGLLDGVIKLKSGGQAATLGRDVLLYALAIGMVIRMRGPLRVPALTGWVVAWVIVVVVQLANPGNYSMSHAVASLRQDLEFVPLFFIGFAALRTHASLHVFFALLLAVAAINGPVAAYQGTLTREQLSAWGPGYARLLSQNIADPQVSYASGTQARVRPPGLGSDEGFTGLLGATALPGGIALLITYRRRRWLLALIVLGLIGALVGVLTSQERGYVLAAIVAVIATLGLLAVGRQGGRSLIALCLVAGMTIVGVIVITSYDPGTLDRYKSIAPSSAASTIYTARGGSWALIPKYMREIPFGAGLGKVGPAVLKAGGTATTWNGEDQFNFLIVETGIPGLLVFLGFQAALFSTILRGIRRESDPETVVLMAALAAPLFGYALAWYSSPNSTSTPSAPYLWLAAGVVSWWLVTRQRETAAVTSLDQLRPL